MKTSFKINQKVFDYSYGWGKIVIIYKEDRLTVLYSGDLRVDYTKKGFVYLNNTNIISSLPTLATKEYTLNGFTQEEQIDYEQYIGKWCKFWDSDSDKDFVISTFYFYNDENEYKFITNDDKCYEFFKPLTEEQIRVLNLSYEDN